MRGSTRRALAVSPLLVGVAPSALPSQELSPAPCAAVSDALRTEDNWRPPPGEYQLTLVSTYGPRAGKSASGTLHLWRTTARDRSPRTGARPERVDTAATPLYGATDMDLAAVGVNLLNRADIPRPDSRDPVYPGVLVHIQNWGQTRRLRQSVLTIGTHGNVRAKLDYAMTDGPGTGLWAREVTPGGFRGTWGPWGLTGGAGHFCAERRGP